MKQKYKRIKLSALKMDTKKSQNKIDSVLFENKCRNSIGYIFKKDPPTGN